ncbi:MAG: NnrU protein [SAR324 cluster bacterium]|nr:NnrU protein [SAR324 cluster bacterium]
MATLTWMILAYAAAPPIALWAHLTAFRTVPLVVMPFALILLVAGLTVRNPAGVGGERGFRGEEAAHGILRVTRHPLQASLLLWAAAHVLANGDLSSLLFFGGFFVLSSWGTVLIDRKRKVALGQDWEAYLRATSTFPFAAILAGRNHFRPGEICWWRGAVGLLLYGALIAAHPYLFGVSPY